MINFFYTDSVYTINVGWIITIQNLNLKFNFCTYVMNQMMIVYTMLMYIRFTHKIKGLRQILKTNFNTLQENCVSVTGESRH